MGELACALNKLTEGLRTFGNHDDQVQRKPSKRTLSIRGASFASEFNRFSNVALACASVAHGVVCKYRSSSGCRWWRLSLRVDVSEVVEEVFLMWIHGLPSTWSRWLCDIVGESPDAVAHGLVSHLFSSSCDKFQKVDAPQKC